jgi:DNA-binding NarL/FixJ family response regulator
MFASDQLCTLAQAAGIRAVVSKDFGGMHDLVEAIEKITTGSSMSNAEAALEPPC